MNADIQKHYKQCATCLEYKQTQPHKKKYYASFGGVVGADTFFFKIKHFCALWITTGSYH